jgi:hypothetical protein
MFIRILLPLPFVSVLCGCTAIDIQELKPTLTSGSGCLTVEKFKTQTPAPGSAPTDTGFAIANKTYGPLILPASAEVLPAGRDGGPTFGRYMQQGMSALEKLPPEFQTNVTRTFLQHVLLASAQGQILAAKNSPVPPGGLPGIILEKWQSDISSYEVPTKISYSEMKDFTRMLFDKGLTPQLTTKKSPLPGGAGNSTSSALAFYFRQYYEGKFVDRFGVKVTKPNLSTGIPISINITDAEIAAAETVLLEYLFDLVDPTPYMGDATSMDKITAATNFYPGGTPASRPTAADAHTANYFYISSSGCGVTTDNVPALVDLANAAGDRAATIGGLTFNSFGGVGVSLGVFGKISIGDNQTLSTLAKNAVSRFATRVAYASEFWLIENLAGGAAPGAAPPQYFHY